MTFRLLRLALSENVIDHGLTCSHVQKSQSIWSAIRTNESGGGVTKMVAMAHEINIEIS